MKAEWTAGESFGITRGIWLKLKNFLSQVIPCIDLNLQTVFRPDQVEILMMLQDTRAENLGLIAKLVRAELFHLSTPVINIVCRKYSTCRGVR